MNLNRGIVEEELRLSVEVIQATLRDCTEEILSTAGCLIESLKKGGKVLLCGNGGSAEQAQHMAAELVVRYRTDRQGLPAIALTANQSVLTAQGNDVGFEWIFSRQVETLGRAGDVLVAISTSGHSPDILRAVESAGCMGMTVVALTGKAESPLKELADLGVFVPSEETPRIQETHLAVIHIWCRLIDEAYQEG